MLLCFYLYILSKIPYATDEIQGWWIQGRGAEIAPLSIQAPHLNVVSNKNNRRRPTFM